MTQYWKNVPIIDGELPSEIRDAFNKIIRSIDARIYKPYECSKDVDTEETSSVEYWIGCNMFNPETNEPIGKCEAIIAKEYDKEKDTYSYKLISYEEK